MPTISYLTRIEFDNGALALLPDIMADLQLSRPMIVTDEGIRAAGILAKLTDMLPDENAVPVFDRTPANPTEKAARDALAVYSENGCHGLIAIGGGSAIDLAKAISLLATHDGPIAQYAAIEGGVQRIGKVDPVIAIPTTAGTGSEVGRAALITLEDGRKLGFISPHLIPSVAVCDPELTLGLPPGLSAATGLDAISHCVETYLSPRMNPVADAIALDGLQRLVSNIETAFRQPENRSARWEMMMGALQGGLTFQKGLGAIHALSHPLGALGRVSLHHGTLNAILLPHVLEWNKPACADKYERMRSVLGLGENADLAAWFADLNARIALPSTLGAIGVERNDLDPVSEAAVKDHSSATNPRTTTQADYLALMESAL
ncbi:MAG: iron-containing alcohol dehydrogenase [Hoeflea sp.]|uniref:iron-containing alcohol dehydrogenase n=1 Tax=Hoeflea sp. TaxID=1940281 RepID=UPI0032ECC066